MKMNKFFAAFVAATMLLTSCSKEEAGNGTITQGEETFAGISISIPSPLASRAEAGAEAGNAATAAESLISNVGVFVVDAAAGTIDKLYLSTGSDFTFNGLTGVATANKAIRTTTGLKTVYVVTNYDGVKAQIDALGAAAFTNNALALGENSFKTESAGTLVNMTMTGSVVETISVQSEADALATPIEIDIYRNLAKVIVRHAAATTPVTGGKHQASTLEFGMISKANGAWLSNTPTTTASSATASAYTGIPTAALSNDAHAYWNNFSAHVLGTTAGVYKAVNAFNSGATAYQTYGGWYCHENIYAASGAGLELYAGNTTSARIRGKFIPNEIVTAIAADGTRTVFNNTSTSTASSFYRLVDGSYWTEGAYTTATGATPGNPDYIAASSFSSKYDGGMGYYRIIVMDEDRVPGVKRNNYYDLAIEAIEGPGSPTEEPDDVIDPLDEESYIAVKVTVKPWWKQSTGHVIQ